MKEKQKIKKYVQDICLAYMDSMSHEITVAFKNGGKKKVKGKVQNHCGELN